MDVRPGDVGVCPGDELMPGRSATTDEVWYVMETLPYGGDVDPTLPMYLGNDITASVGALLKNEPIHLDMLGNEVALDEPSSRDLPMKVPASMVSEDMVPEESGSPEEVPLSSYCCEFLIYPFFHLEMAQVHFML